MPRSKTKKDVSSSFEDSEEECFYDEEPNYEIYVLVYCLDKQYYPHDNTHIVAIMHNPEELVCKMLEYCEEDMAEVFSKAIDNCGKNIDIEDMDEDEYFSCFVEYLSEHHKLIHKWTDGVFDMVEFDKFNVCEYEDWDSGFIEGEYTDIVGYIKGGENEYLPELESPYKKKKRDKSPKKTKR